ncbi:MAG: SHOCT domain-containing protein [Syntrophobacteraceae bacterium]|jgi:putative membrane protein
MWGYVACCFGCGWWWIIPLAMIIMMVLCFFMMRCRMERMMGGPFSRTCSDSCWGRHSESAGQILDKRYARGEIGKEEYEERKRDMDRN